MDRFLSLGQSGSANKNRNWSTPSDSFGKAFQSLFDSRGKNSIGGAFKSIMGDANSGVGSAWGNLSGMAGSGNPYASSASSMSNIGSWNQSGGLNAPTIADTAANMGAGLAGGGIATRNPNFGQFSKTPEVYDHIDQAAAKYGVDANVMQVFMNRESSGDWYGNGNAGNTVHIGRAPWFDDIYPFIGTYKKTALSRGVTEREWNAARGNMGAQVDMLGKMLKSMIDQNGFTSPENLFAYYFSGQTDPNSTWSDGSLTVRQYVSSAMKELGMVGGPAGTGSGMGRAASGSVSTIWGGKGERDLSYGFGAPNNLGYYDYGKLYGMDGRAHTGVDIPMNIGEPVVSPVSGTVVCGGTGVGGGAGAGSGGCSAFGDVMGKGAGRVEVLLDNGESVIFGHMSTSNFRPGQRINAGQVVGEAGGMNGGHVHLEWRTRDSSTQSGWRIVDPMGKLGGAAISSAPAQQAQASTWRPKTGTTTVAGYRF